MIKIPVYRIKVPDYTIKIKPDYLRIGKKVDRILEKKFPDGKYIIRAIGSQDHPSLSVNNLIKIILKIGTDKYDSERKSVAHEEFSGYDYDIQAGTFEIKNSKIIANKSDKIPSVFGGIVYHFYEHTPFDRGYPVRIDLLIIYDPAKLIRARKFHSKAQSVRVGLNKYLYKFKYRKNKRDVLRGIIKIL